MDGVLTQLSVYIIVNSTTVPGTGASGVQCRGTSSGVCSTKSVHIHQKQVISVQYLVGLLDLPRIREEFAPYLVFLEIK